MVGRYLAGASGHYRSVFLPGQNAVSGADLAAHYPLPNALEQALTVVVAQ
ncbi:MAG: hypothetical protein O7E49_13530 [Gemmatimonadetes bacterium]|nr:hypothetical protein [Gemmatimonadota bacterium]